MLLPKLKNYTLELVVFLSGASLMILEVVGSRVLAPYVGTSTLIWTILIGVILSFLSLGYYIGGKYADRKANLEILSNILFLSSFSVFFIILINKPVLGYIEKNVRLYSLGSILLTTALLFSLPSFLLGMVSPYAAKLKLKALSTSGDTIGKLYALSTIGSIGGTFLGGLFLIPLLGTINILSLITIILIITSILIKRPPFFSKKTFFTLLLFVALLIYYFQAHTEEYIIDTDTSYNRVFIKRTLDEITGRPIINLMTSHFVIQSQMFTDKDDDLVTRYTKYYRLGNFFNPYIKRALVIGGGGYSYPKDFLLKHQNAKLDVVEIDPGITRLAKSFFNLKDDPRLKIFNEDGRVFLNFNKNKYDAIYIDAFNSIAVPYQLTTKETSRKLFDSLSENGLVILNIISSFEGKNNKFFKSEFATYKTVFPLVFAFQENPREKAQSFQNIILVALRENRKIELSSTDSELNSYLKTVWKKKIVADSPILTDDNAVDHYDFNLF